MTDGQSPADISAPAAARPGSAKRKPRIALMGEFSAGKSTLSNLLLGQQALPMQVTATQLPPVWIRQGSKPPYRVTTTGDEVPVDFTAVASIPLEETNYIRIFRQADLLGFCDLIDMPGISDPNMAPEVWQRVLHHADGIIWCTHATQAWRQSEAAVWETIPRGLQARSMLLLTRFDKIRGEKDRRRVLSRVRKETAGQFAGIFPISLVEALEADEDHDVWEASGADAFVQALIDLLHRLGHDLGTDFESATQAASAPAEDVHPDQIPSPTGFGGAIQQRRAAKEAELAAIVQPRRVVGGAAGAARPRPERSA